MVWLHMVMERKRANLFPLWNHPSFCSLYLVEPTRIRGKREYRVIYGWRLAYLLPLNLNHLFSPLLSDSLDLLGDLGNLILLTSLMTSDGSKEIKSVRAPVLATLSSTTAKTILLSKLKSETMLYEGASSSSSSCSQESKSNESTTPLHLPPPPTHYIPCLMGDRISNSEVLKDLDGTRTVFFVIWNIGIRTEGFYRFKFTLNRLRTNR